MWKWIIGIVVAVIVVSSGGSDEDATNTEQAVPAAGQVQNVVPQKAQTGEKPATSAKTEANPVATVEIEKPKTAETVAPTKTIVTPSCGEDYYRNVDGICVHRPSASPNASPSGATARCRDGSYSYSLNHRGTCSHHGGVASWL